MNDERTDRLAGSFEPRQHRPVIDDYEVLEKVAEGSRSTVHRARDRRSGQTVALKRLGDKSGYQEWEREVTALDLISGLGVIQLLESGRLTCGGYLVLEWLSGPTLEARATERPLSLHEFSIVASSALHSLNSVHQAGFLHCDVKPSNFMRADDGIWKLIDFGEARRIEDASRQPLVGSIHAMAPEQFENGRLDERTDYYALGCTLHFALTGRFAHAGETTPQVITSHLHPDPSELAQSRPDLPQAVVSWVEGLMSRYPQDRPQNYREALDALMYACFDSHS
jgi:serine/threonine-protein kinase